MGLSLFLNGIADFFFKPHALTYFSYKAPKYLERCVLSKLCAQQTVLKPEETALSDQGLHCVPLHQQ